VVREELQLFIFRNVNLDFGKGAFVNIKEESIFLKP
jgi:hypothetical protein